MGFLYIHYEHQTLAPDKDNPKERIIPISDIREIRPATQDEMTGNVKSAIVTERCVYFVRQSVSEIADRMRVLDLSLTKEEALAKLKDEVAKRPKAMEDSLLKRKPYGDAKFD